MKAMILTSGVLLLAAAPIQAQHSSTGTYMNNAGIQAAALGVAHRTANDAISLVNRGTRTIVKTGGAAASLHRRLLGELQAQRDAGRKASADPILVRRILKLIMALNNGRLKAGNRFKRYPSDADFDRAAARTKADIDRYAAQCRAEIDIPKSKFASDKISGLEDVGMARLVASMPIDPSLTSVPEAPPLDPEDEALRGQFAAPPAVPLPFPNR